MLSDHFEPNRGGAVEIARIEAANLARDHEVQTLAGNEFDLAYPKRWRNFLGIYNPRAIKILKQHLANNHYDICYLHNINVYWSYYCLAVLKRAGIKTIVTCHDVTAVTPYVKLCPMRSATDYQYSFLRELRDAKWHYNPLRRVFVRKYLGQATEVRAVSQALSDFLTTNGIRVDRIVHNKLRKLENAASETYEDTIFFGGRLSTAKGALQAVEYLATLKQKYKITPKLLVAGRAGTVTNKMTNLAKKLEVAEQISFLGWLAEKDYNSLLNTAGIVIVPSICFDSFPTVILEAMRAGRPVVATIFGGSREMVEEGRTGFIRDPRDIAGFAESIAALLADSQQQKVFGKNAYQRFQQEFTLP